MTQLPSGIHIGASGWNYDGWKGVFYPEKITGNAMLDAYVKTFSTVEVNGTFYSLPEPETVADWSRRVPADFLFSVKASRYITHMKKLKDPEEPLSNLFEILESFGDKLGPVLFQLPPGWNADTERLEHFLKQLPKCFRYTFEFRDESWFCEEVYALLDQYRVSLCFYDYEKKQSPHHHFADFVYLRLHGPEATAYKGSYPDETLDDYAKNCLSWRKNGQSIFVYFDNDEKAQAPRDAQRLINRVKGS